MVDREQQRQLLEAVMDGLDDLYDQRFGSPVGRDGPQPAEVWLIRLLQSTAAALEGSGWEAQLRDSAEAIQRLLGGGGRGGDLNDAALDATGDLRTAIAREI